MNNNNRRRQAIFWGAFDGTSLSTEGEPLSCRHDTYARASLALSMLVGQSDVDHESGSISIDPVSD